MVSGGSQIDGHFQLNLRNGDHGKNFIFQSEITKGEAGLLVRPGIGQPGLAILPNLPVVVMHGLPQFLIGDGFLGRFLHGFRRRHLRGGRLFGRLHQFEETACAVLYPIVQVEATNIWVNKQDTASKKDKEHDRHNHFPCLTHGASSSILRPAGRFQTRQPQGCQRPSP